MRYLRLFIAISFFISSSELLWAATDNGLPGAFLNFGVGARAMGMGRAYTGVADDVDALYFNPAGLATFRSSQVTFQHSPLPVDGDFQYIGYSQPLYALGSLGIGIVNYNSGDVPRVDSNNIEVGTFDARETGYLVGYGHRFGDKFHAGGTVKMAENSIDGRLKRGFGLDAGALYRFNDRIQAGATMRNAVAPTYDFATDKEEFPRVLQTGVAANFLNNHLLTALDVSKTVGTSQGVKYHFGVEGFVIENVAIRFGIDQTEITTGMGLRWRNIQFDYAGGYQDLGFINRFAMKFFFGGYDVDVKASPRIFSPTGIKNKVTFKITTAHRERIVKWIMTIRNPNNEVVRSFQGFNEPPRIIEWDGKDAKGKAVPPGRYTYRMVITDAKNRMEKTPRRSIRVLAPSPFEIEAR